MYNIILGNIAMMLIAFLLVSARCRKEKEPMEGWSTNEWGGYITISFLWPTALAGLFVDEVWPLLIKERNYNPDIELKNVE